MDEYPPPWEKEGEEVKKVCVLHWLLCEEFWTCIPHWRHCEPLRSAQTSYASQQVQDTHPNDQLQYDCEVKNWMFASWTVSYYKGQFYGHRVIGNNSWDDPRWKHQGPNYTQRLWEDRSQEVRAKTQGGLEWRASGCWIALYIYYSTRGLHKAIHEAMYCAMLC